MIYALIDPRTQEVKYVGHTFMYGKKRFRAHIKNSKLRCTANWLRELRAAKLEPIYQELEDAPRRISRIREAYWIHQYISTVLNRNKKLHWTTN